MRIFMSNNKGFLLIEALILMQVVIIIVMITTLSVKSYSYIDKRDYNEENEVYTHE